MAMLLGLFIGRGFLLSEEGEDDVEQDAEDDAEDAEQHDEGGTGDEEKEAELVLPPAQVFEFEGEHRHFGNHEDIGNDRKDGQTNHAGRAIEYCRGPFGRNDGCVCDSVPQKFKRSPR